MSDAAPPPPKPPTHCPDCGNRETVARSKTIHWCPSCLFGWHPELRPPDAVGPLDRG